MPNEEGAAFMNQLRESVEDMQRSGMSESEKGSRASGSGMMGTIGQSKEESLTFLTLQSTTVS